MVSRGGGGHSNRVTVVTVAFGLALASLAINTKEINKWLPGDYFSSLDAVNTTSPTRWSSWVRRNITFSSWALGNTTLSSGPLPGATFSSWALPNTTIFSSLATANSSDPNFSDRSFMSRFGALSNKSHGATFFNVSMPLTFGSPSVVSCSNSSNLAGDFFSACMLTMDDNHFLIEWLAYHWYTLPLRHIIFAVDPNSRTSPTKIFDRWRAEGMIIEEWSDKDFMDDNMVKRGTMLFHNLTEKERFDLYLYRQQSFIQKCLNTLKVDKRDWVLLADSDEYLVLNTGKAIMENLSVPSMAEPGAILAFIRQLQKRNSSIIHSPCVNIPRLRHSARESTRQITRSFNTSVLNVSKFQTLRFRKHAARHDQSMNKIAKVMLDISRIDSQDFNGGSIHRPVLAHCSYQGMAIQPIRSFFVLHHYLGTWEQFNFRADVRKGKGRARHPDAYDAFNGVDIEDDWSIQRWIEGFVNHTGLEKAKELLDGVGDIDLSSISTNTTFSSFRESSFGELSENQSSGATSSAMPLESSPSTWSSYIRSGNDTVPVDFFSACMLIMDDNHFLIEWLAYHWYTLPLRHVIFAVDPNSRTSPTKIFDRWRAEGMIIEEWSDRDFISESMAEKGRSNLTEKRMMQHLFRQNMFVNKCLKALKTKKREWVLLSDSDEYLVLNRPKGLKENLTVPSMGDPGAVLRFLRKQQRQNSSMLPPCVNIGRLRHGAQESTRQIKRLLNTSLFNVSEFQTLRFRRHAARYDQSKNKLAKVMVDVSRIDARDFNGKSIHVPVPAHCPYQGMATQPSKSFYVLHHYLGTWEQFSFRDDPRKGKGDPRHRDYYDDLNQVFIEDDLSMQAWIEGFVNYTGLDKAKYLLKGVGNVMYKP